MSIKRSLKDKDELREQLVERVREIKKAQAETWEQRIREARIKFHKIAAKTDLEHAEQHIFGIAENLCVENWEIPPHWTDWYVCDFCGHMPGPKGTNNQKVIACPWCHSHPPKFDRFEIDDFNRKGIDYSKSENIGVRDAFNKAVSELDEAF